MKKIWFLFLFSLLLVACLPRNPQWVKNNSANLNTTFDMEEDTLLAKQQSGILLSFHGIVEIDSERKHTDRERDLVFRGDFGTHTVYLTLPFQLKREISERFPNQLFVGNLIQFTGEVKEDTPPKEKGTQELHYEILDIQDIKVLRSIFDLSPEQREELEKRKQIFTAFLLKRLNEPDQKYYFLDTMDGSGKRELLELSQEALRYDWKDCKLDKIGNYLVKGTLVSKQLKFCFEEGECWKQALEEFRSIVPTDKNLPELCSFGLPLGKASGDALVGRVREARSNTGIKRSDSISHFAGMQGKNLRPLVNDGKEHTFRVFSFLTEGYEGYSAESSAVLDWEIIE